MCIDFFPKPIDGENCAWGMVCVRSTPVVGLVVAEVQRCYAALPEKATNAQENARAAKLLEYSKCERAGALITVIAAIALLILGFSVAGAIALAVGCVMLVYTCKTVHKDTLLVKALPSLQQAEAHWNDVTKVYGLHSKPNSAPSSPKAGNPVATAAPSSLDLTPPAEPVPATPLSNPGSTPSTPKAGNPAATPAPSSLDLTPPAEPVPATPLPHSGSTPPSPKATNPAATPAPSSLDLPPAEPVPATPLPHSGSTPPSPKATNPTPSSALDLTPPAEPAPAPTLPNPGSTPPSPKAANPTPSSSLDLTPPAEPAPAPTLPNPSSTPPSPKAANPTPSSSLDLTPPAEPAPASIEIPLGGVDLKFTLSPAVQKAQAKYGTRGPDLDLD